MDITQMHWEFKQRANKLDSNHKKDLSDAEIDALINDIQHLYIETYYSGNIYNRNKLGFESVQQRTDMLSTLVVGQPEQVKLLPVLYNSDLEVYEFDFDGLKYKYKHLIRVYYIDPTCGKFNIKLEQHDDINLLLDDAFRGPSFQWRSLIATIKSSSDIDSESSLYVYTNGVIDISSGIYVEYIKEPVDVFLGTYDSIDYVNCINDGGNPASCNVYYNTTTDRVSSEIPENYHTLLIDMCVQEFARRLENINRYNLVTEKIK